MMVLGCSRCYEYMMRQEAVSDVKVSPRPSIDHRLGRRVHGSAERSGACPVVSAVVLWVRWWAPPRPPLRAPIAWGSGSAFSPHADGTIIGRYGVAAASLSPPRGRGPDWPRQLTQVSSVEGRAVEVVVPLLPRVRRRHQTDRRPAGPCMVWIRE